MNRLITFMLIASASTLFGNTKITDDDGDKGIQILLDYYEHTAKTD